MGRLQKQSFCAKCSQKFANDYLFGLHLKLVHKKVTNKNDKTASNKVLYEEMMSSLKNLSKESQVDSENTSTFLYEEVSEMKNESFSRVHS